MQANHKTERNSSKLTSVYNEQLTGLKNSLNSMTINVLIACASQLIDH